MDNPKQIINKIKILLSIILQGFLGFVNESALKFSG